MDTRRLAVIAAFLSFLASPFLGGTMLADARAQDDKPGFYTLFGWGTYKEDSELGIPVTTNNYAWRIYLGYQLNDYLSAEAGWVDFDRIEYNAGCPSGSGLNDNVETDGTHVRARLSLPFSRDNSYTASVFATGGYYFWGTVDECKNAAGTTQEIFKESDSDVTYGVGLSYLGKSGGLTLEYEVFKIKGPSINDQDFDLMSINFLIYF
jgi:hypothetical protein